MSTTPKTKKGPTVKDLVRENATQVMWAVVLLLVVVTGGFVALSLTGHRSEAEELGGAAAVLLFYACMFLALAD